MNQKLRQEQVNLLQTDPRTRVAIVSITAAGIAISLTAASTVWFAEMHWTPAKLLQAEDRAHRIGQLAEKVHILYFVAKGSLDEVLWELAMKKFQAVGEMVDGNRFASLEHDGDQDVELLDVSLDFEGKNFHFDIDDDEEEQCVDRKMSTNHTDSVDHELLARTLNMSIDLKD